MAKIFNVTNHTATEMQINDAKRMLGVVECVDLPESLKKRWGEVPPETDSVVAFVQPVLDWLGQVASKDDVVWAQGEWGGNGGRAPVVPRPWRPVRLQHNGAYCNGKTCCRWKHRDDAPV